MDQQYLINWVYDVRRSYLQVPLTEDSRYIIEFISHEGVYQYTHMCYELSSAPSAFQKILSSILEECHGCAHIIDDVVVHGNGQVEHDRNLNQVMARINKHNLKLNDEKCHYSVGFIDFAGYTISGGSVTSLKSNVTANQNLPEPGDVKHLQSFLGTTNFYLKFVPDYPDIAETLRELLRKDEPWVWGQEQTEAFVALKQKFASQPILAHFYLNLSTYVTSDASSNAIGAVLSQIDGKTERPVAFASRTLSMTERKYSTSEREALAAVFACEHWYMYLYGRKFTLRTDHQALKTLLSTSATEHKPLRIYRWVDRLLQFDFQVEHISGSNNVVADMLSRLIPDDNDQQQPTVCDELIFGIDVENLVTQHDLIEASKQDETQQSENIHPDQVV